MSALPAHWTACLAQLQGLQQATEAAQAAAIATITSGQPEAYAVCCRELAQSLASSQAQLAQALQQGMPPAAVQLAMAQVKAGLDALQETNTRLQARMARTLHVLFPQDQVQAYSRLGKGYGAQPKPGSGYLKA